MKIIKALEFATYAHKDQKRKYTNEPYFNHCLEVMMLVSKITDDEDILCACLLHDVVEDTDYTIEDIEERFGYDVAELVDGLTDISSSEDGERSKRKKIDRHHIALGCKNVKTIKLADTISNTQSIHEHDPEFAKIYMEEKRLLLNVLTSGDQKLYNIASNIVNDYYNKH